MIFNFILAIVAFMVNGVASVLPSITIFPAGLADQIANFMSSINGWAWLVPIDTVMTVFGVLVLLVLVEFIYFTAMYILSIVHASIRG